MKTTNNKPLKTWEEIQTDWESDPKYIEELKKREPEYQLARQMIKARLTREMTQAELAKEVGTDQAVISRLENMSAHPSLDLIRRVAKALNTPIRLTIN
jgi:DNA-binding XRE family transcriptional regulator